MPPRGIAPGDFVGLKKTPTVDVGEGSLAGERGGWTRTFSQKFSLYLRLVRKFEAYASHVGRLGRPKSCSSGRCRPPPFILCDLLLFWWGVSDWRGSRIAGRRRQAGTSATAPTAERHTNRPRRWGCRGQGFQPRHVLRHIAARTSHAFAQAHMLAPGLVDGSEYSVSKIGECRSGQNYNHDLDLQGDRFGCPAALNIY